MVLDSVDKGQHDFQDRNENSNNLNNSNNTNKIFVIKSVDIYNTNNNSPPNKSPSLIHHPHDKIIKNDYIELSKEDEEEITKILENTPNLNKEITIIKSPNVANSYENSNDNYNIGANSINEKEFLIINNLNSSNLIFNNNNISKDGANSILNESSEKSYLNFNNF
ncbi:expressed protein, partial [Dictyostelium purpureum]